MSTCDRCDISRVYVGVARALSWSGGPVPDELELIAAHALTPTWMVFTPLWTTGVTGIIWL